MPTIDTSLLRIAYDEWNPDGERTMVLVHGWPDSPRCWRHVGPALAREGWRVLAPALRGHAPTRFLHEATPRTGQLTALGRDLVEFVAGLGLQRPALVGHDWGARAVGIACGLQPGIASHLCMLSVGYGTNTADQPLPLAMARNYWYHWYMATPRGEHTVRTDGRNFARIMWDTWSPPGWFDEAEFEATAQAFAGDGWADVTLHSYRHRWGHAAGDPRYAADEASLTPPPALDVPTLVLHGEADAVNHPDTSAGKEAFFRGRYVRRLLPGIGHFPQREDPAAVVAAIAEFTRT